jgi:hypothetical protein
MNNHITRKGVACYAPTFMAILFMATLAFADTLYLKDGSEIKDAKIVKIDVDKVEYKIGKKEVLYTAKKSDIAIIFYADGTKETFKDEGSSSEKQPIININQNVNQNNNQNVNVAVGTQSVVKEPVYRCGFTAGERWGTFFLNAIPGLGSIAVMDDWTGAIVHWSWVGSGLVALMVSEFLTPPNHDGVRTDIDKFSEIVGYIAILSSPVWNSYRSYSYCKPGSVACGSNGGFNISVLPTRHGSLLPAVTYSKSF